MMSLPSKRNVMCFQILWVSSLIMNAWKNILTNLFLMVISQYWSLLD